MQHVVADTSALVSLGVPGADATYDIESNPDPLQCLLTSTDVTIPSQVRIELEETAQYGDIHGVAANNVLAAHRHYEVEDPYTHPEAPDERPVFGLDAGETDGIVLANTIDANGFVTDEFGGTNFPVIHAALTGPRIVPAPRLICEYAWNDHLERPEARARIQRIGRHRSWDASAYVSLLLELL